MIRLLTFISALITVFMINAETFSYHFNSITLPKALQKIIADHPDLEINFIYNELENYQAAPEVDADNPYDALRQMIGLNPVIVAKIKNTYYIEALQHGKYVYDGKIIGEDNEPVVAATVMLLAPKDSTVLTYGITDDTGCFTIPCDRQGVLAKLSCIGYKTTYKYLDSPVVGIIHMNELPIQLNTVTVEGENATLMSDKSIYRPTQRQKNASQTGDELLSHMAIPQLGMITNGNITTNSGKKVAIYIDFLPATENELKAMNVKDVKKVEFYTSPSDPRFHGNENVINFIMQQYEYGGYVKGLSFLNLISYSEQFLASTRFNIKR